MRRQESTKSIVSRAAGSGVGRAVLQFLTSATQKWTLLAATVPVLLLVAVDTCGAANWYVRPSASGSANGSDWNNAWSASAISWGSVSPGDTIWFAGGTYSSFFNLGKSGTSSNPISIKRATATDSVPTTAAGWNSSFDAPANFTFSSWSTTYSYLIIDGRTEYGIYINASAQNSTTVLQFSYGNGIQLKYIKMKGPGWTATAGYGIWFIGGSGHLVSHCMIDGIIQQVSLNGVTGCVVEYSTFLNCGPATNPNAHPDVLYTDNASNLIYRYNVISNCQSECLFFSYGSSGGMYIYGNTFDMGANGTGVAIETHQDFSYGDFHVFNNTFKSWYTSVYFRGTMSGNNEVYNNLFWNTVNFYEGGVRVTSDYNGYSGGVPSGESHSYSSSSNPFVSANTGNFHLLAGAWPANRGKPLALDGYMNKDKDGNTRGADGTWDLGAYEYGSVSTNPVISVTPSVLTFGALLPGKTATNYFTVQNVGGGTLSGTASKASGPSAFSIVSGQTYSLGTGQSAQIGILYSPASASDSASFAFSGGGQATATASGSVAAVLSGLSFPAYAGIVTAPFSTNGGYLSQTVDVSNDGQTGVASGGRAVYTFSLSTPGNYVVSASVNAPNAASKSFWVNIDGEPIDPTMIWDVYPYTSGFETRTISWRGGGTPTADEFTPQVFGLTAGVHQLIVVGREANTQLGQITIQPYSASHPTLPAAPQNLRVVATQ